MNVWIVLGARFWSRNVGYVGASSRSGWHVENGGYLADGGPKLPTGSAIS